MKPTLYIDIETIPGPEEGRALIEVKAPSQYKKQDSIRAWMDANGDAERESIYRKQSFNGGYGQVCTIGFAVDDRDVGSFHITRRDQERDMLREFLDETAEALPFGDQPEICGHFVAGFDLKFLRQRCIIHGIKMPHWLAVNRKPWEIRDTMTLWAGVRDTIGLNELCEILGIETKGDMDGSKVYDAWTEGRHEEIIRYCRADVNRVQQVDAKFRAAGI